MSFNYRKIYSLAACGALLMSATVLADPIPGKGSGEVTSTGLNIVYDPPSGRLQVEGFAGEKYTGMQIESIAKQLLNANCQGLSGPFDVCTNAKVFKLNPDGFGNHDFGLILPANLSGEELLSDLTIDGSSTGGGFRIGDGPWIVHPDFMIPEPTSFSLLGIGLGLVVASLRRRSRA